MSTKTSLDFWEIEAVEKGNYRNVDILPIYIAKSNVRDVIIKGGKFYAFWNPDKNVWSTDQLEMIEIVNRDVMKFASEYKETHLGVNVKVTLLGKSTNSVLTRFLTNYGIDHGDTKKDVILDSKVIFNNDEIKRSDYATFKLSYDIGDGPMNNYEELISTLYDEEERHKIEWAIGSIITGQSKKLQKFMVLYGAPGTGKSTVLHIIKELLAGYWTAFSCRELLSGNNSFPLSAFKDNPLIAIDEDGDLSKIENNDILNKLVSHDPVIINAKFMKPFDIKPQAMLFAATNDPIQIKDATAGIKRRLIDINPTGNLIPNAKYNRLMEGIKFELGAIANHCKNVFMEAGANYYDDYRSTTMTQMTDEFYWFIEEQFERYSQIKGDKFVTVAQEYELYKKYKGDKYICQRKDFFRHIKPYFNEVREQFYYYEDDIRYKARNALFEFKTELVYPEKKKGKKNVKDDGWIRLKWQQSLFDKDYGACPAQYANADGYPSTTWTLNKSELCEIDANKLHYVRVPIEHIVLDFDIPGPDGEKSLEENLKVANKFPETYAEVSKSGNGIHLHYIWKGGNPEDLASKIDDKIEIKVFKGKSALRRQLTLCNDIPIATLTSGLPMKEKKGVDVISDKTIQDEQHLIAVIKKALRKEIHDSTKPNIDFIAKVLDDAYNSGMVYDVTTLKKSIYTFATQSTHQAEYCIKAIDKMHFKSDTDAEPIENIKEADKPIIFFDTEVFPNLFLLNYKVQGEGRQVVRMINPTGDDIQSLLNLYRLVGFNNRKYDNHILWARVMGYTNKELFKLSQRLVSGKDKAYFGSAYGLSYADIYDFSSKKQSLKKFEIELGIHHKELGLPWDQPVPEEMWIKVAEYCDNDVIATEAVFNDRYQDFVARQVLADLSGLTVNNTTRMHATKIIFGDERNPDLVYTDLSEMFPGYTFERGHSNYRGEDPGEGGYVFSQPGIYYDVALLDIASMHPSSIRALNLFGEYTKNFTDILDARIAIKHHDFKKAGEYLNGAFKPYLKDEAQADQLAQALKIVINSVYGYTSATFDNPFKDPRNVDNIVAKRGALFMINLKHEVQDRGFTVAHIKTDSIKIPNATPEIIEFVMEYGKKYGYNFEHEDTYSKICLVNDAAYIAKYLEPHFDKKDKEKKNPIWWTATATQFQVPYVFKTLFSKEPIEFNDLCETKAVSTSLYLDFNEDLPEGEHEYHFVGKVGRFCPMLPGSGGGYLLREKEGKYSFATGSKGYRWCESEIVKSMHKEDCVDISYYEKLAEDAVKTISEYGDFDAFAS